MGVLALQEARKQASKQNAGQKSARKQTKPVMQVYIVSTAGSSSVGSCDQSTAHGCSGPAGSKASRQAS